MKNHIEIHKTCIKILEGIETFERHKYIYINAIYGVAGTFPELRMKYLRKLQIYDMCIERLKSRYEKQLKQLL